VNLPDALKIHPTDYPDPASLLALLHQELERPQDPSQQTVTHAIPSSFVKGVAEAATNTWRAKIRMLDPVSGEVREEMRRVYRHVEAALEALTDLGIQLKDHTGEPFDYGSALKVITTQPTPGIERESVIETIRPTIYWKQQMIQIGEVVIATPAPHSLPPL